MTAEAVPKVSQDNRRVVGVLAAAIIKVARQAEIGLGRAVREGKGHRAFRWGCVAGRTVLAYVMAAAEGGFVVGIEAYRGALVRVCAQASGRGTRVTGFAGLGLRHMREEFSLGEVGKAVTGRAVFFSVVHGSRTIFFMALGAGFLLSMQSREACNCRSVFVDLGVLSRLDFSRAGGGGIIGFDFDSFGRL